MTIRVVTERDTQEMPVTPDLGSMYAEISMLLVEQKRCNERVAAAEKRLADLERYNNEFVSKVLNVDNEYRGALMSLMKQVLVQLDDVKMDLRRDIEGRALKPVHKPRQTKVAP